MTNVKTASKKQKQALDREVAWAEKAGSYDIAVENIKGSGAVLLLLTSKVIGIKSNVIKIGARGKVTSFGDRKR